MVGIKVKTLCSLLAFALLNDVKSQPLTDERSSKNKPMEQWTCTSPHLPLPKVYKREMVTSESRWQIQNTDLPHYLSFLYCKILSLSYILPVTKKQWFGFKIENGLPAVNTCHLLKNPSGGSGWWLMQVTEDKTLVFSFPPVSKTNYPGLFAIFLFFSRYFFSL